MEEADRKAIHQIMGTAEKLLHETQRLHRDVCRLLGRIEPFEDEPKLPVWPDENVPIITLVEAFNVIEKARRTINNAEYGINRIDHFMNDIVNSPVRREEMKPYLK